MEKGHAVYSTKSKILRGIVWVLMLILALFMVFPILYIILGSFKENSELLVGGTNILPSHWYFPITQMHGSRLILLPTL